MAGDDVAHELGLLAGTLEGVQKALGEHVRQHERWAERVDGTLNAILTQTTATNGRVNNLQKWQGDVVTPHMVSVSQDLSTLKSTVAQLWTWRDQREPVIALVRKEELDAAAVKRWWQTTRGRVGLVFGVATVVVGGALQVAAGLKAVFGW